MTLHAVFEVSDTFPQMLRPDSIRLVFVTPVASVAVVVVVDVTGRAYRVVDALKKEELGVVERGWLPLLLAVTLPTVRSDIAMDVGRGRRVARLTPAPARGGPGPSSAYQRRAFFRPDR